MADTATMKYKKCCSCSHPLTINQGAYCSPRCEEDGVNECARYRKALAEIANESLDYGDSFEGLFLGVKDKAEKALRGK